MIWALPTDSVGRLVGRRLEPVCLELVLDVRLQAAGDLDPNRDFASPSAVSAAPAILAYKINSGLGVSRNIVKFLGLENYHLNYRFGWVTL